MTVEELIKKFPLVYDGTYTHTKAWESVPEKWVSMIDSMLTYIQWNTDNNGWPQIKCILQKKVFGGLRWGYIAPNEKELEIRALVDYIEFISYNI